MRMNQDPKTALWLTRLGTCAVNGVHFFVCLRRNDEFRKNTPCPANRSIGLPRLAFSSKATLFLYLRNWKVEENHPINLSIPSSGTPNGRVSAYNTMRTVSPASFLITFRIAAFTGKNSVPPPIGMSLYCDNS